MSIICGYCNRPYNPKNEPEHEELCEIDYDEAWAETERDQAEEFINLIIRK